MATIQDVRDFLRTADASTMKLVLEIWNSRWRHLNAEVGMALERGDEVTGSYGKRPVHHFRGVVVGFDTKGRVHIQTTNYVSGRYRGNSDLRTNATPLKTTGNKGEVKP